jgi:hypothetical protein
MRKRKEVLSSWDLCAGTYCLLPSLVEDELAQPGQRLERPGEVDEARRAEQRRAASRRMDYLLRSKLLSVSALQTHAAARRTLGCRCCNASQTHAQLHQ